MTNGSGPWDYVRLCTEETWRAARAGIWSAAKSIGVPFAVGWLAFSTTGADEGAKAPVAHYEFWRLVFTLALTITAAALLSGYRVWRTEAQRIEGLKTERNAAVTERDAARAEVAAAVARVAAVPPSNVDLAIRFLKRTQCPGDKKLTGAKFFYYAYPEVVAKRAWIATLAHLAGVIWVPDKRETTRAAFQQFMHSLAREELLGAPELPDVPWSVGKLGADVWKRLREEEEPSGDGA